MTELALTLGLVGAIMAGLWLWVRARSREAGLLGRIHRLEQEVRARATERDERDATFQSVMSSLLQGVLVIDGEGVAYANPAAAALLGTVPGTLAGLVPHGVQTLIRRARERKAVAESSFEHGAPVRILHAVASPFPDGRRVLLAITDVTEPTRVEAVRRDFVASASHELKTPVTSILASAETLQMALGKDLPAAERFAAQITSSGRQLARLVSDLLDLSRLESQAPPSERVEIDQVVAAEIERALPAAEAAGVRLTANLVPAGVVGNAADLALAIRNLVDNALRHTSRGGTVEVTLVGDDGRVEVSVEDTGEGIPQRELSRIFERFYRIDVARSRATGGTGLGLAIVKHVAERHGGTVTARSQLGVGSTFLLRLPGRPGDNGRLAGDPKAGNPKEEDQR
jgi:two-component system sensor histidine kinase SenX3